MYQNQANEETGAEDSKDDGIEEAEVVEENNEEKKKDE